MKPKLVIVDDILSVNDAYQISEQIFNRQSTYSVLNWANKNEILDCMMPLITEASKYFSIENYVGIEWWAHDSKNKYPHDWHYDMDDSSWYRKKELKFPLCTIIYYSLIQDLQGGRLLTEDITVTPKTNRCIFMAPGLFHKVEDYINGRHMLAICPWEHYVTLDRQVNN